ncbi:MAG: methyl-accepting chemotaxis protein [Burkholderiaceae bacterium]
MAFKLSSLSLPTGAGSRHLDPDTAIVDDSGAVDLVDPDTAADMEGAATGEAFEPTRTMGQGSQPRGGSESVGEPDQGSGSRASTSWNRRKSVSKRRFGGRHDDHPMADEGAAGFDGDDDDDSDVRATAVADLPIAPRHGFMIPWLSRQPLQRQANLLLTIIGLSVLLASLLGILGYRESLMSRLQTDMVNTAMIESQRLSKSAAVAATGNDDAFVQLRDSARNLTEAIGAMGSGGLFKGLQAAPLSSDHQSGVSRASRLMKDLAPDVAAILDARGRPPLASTAEGRELASRVFFRGEQLGDAVSAVRRAANFDDYRSYNLAGIIGFAGLVILGFLLLGKAYYDESWRKAAEAQEQRAEAERLEQEAKRINDQNQAAILRLMNELQEVADGDLTVQATVSEDITGAIADSVNYTVEELRDLVGRINRTAAAVADASSRAQMTSSSLQAASDQQSREIRETGESVLGMASQIKQVSESAAQSASVARQSLSAADKGRQAVENAISGMNGIRDQIQETAKRIKRLGESSQEIGEIIELISDITEQTNVLALNAAIQAASAGEAGRGFTIVAEEVQRLAERSAEATRQISALVKAIQTDTHDAVAAMERSTTGVVEGARLSDEAGTALGGIGEVSRELADLIMKISRTTEDQAVSAEAVAQSIQRILLVTEQTSEGTQQTAGSILQLAELARELKNSVARFRVA